MGTDIKKEWKKTAGIAVMMSRALDNRRDRNRFWPGDSRWTQFH